MSESDGLGVQCDGDWSVSDGCLKLSLALGPDVVVAGDSDNVWGFAVCFAGRLDTLVRILAIWHETEVLGGAEGAVDDAPGAALASGITIEQLLL